MKCRRRTCGPQNLQGHLQAGLFITKFRKTFARDEMNDDLLLIPARLNDQSDDSEYQEIPADVASVTSSIRQGRVTQDESGR